MKAEYAIDGYFGDLGYKSDSTDTKGGYKQFRVAFNPAKYTSGVKVISAFFQGPATAIEKTSIGEISFAMDDSDALWSDSAYVDCSD